MAKLRVTNIFDRIKNRIQLYNEKRASHHERAPLPPIPEKVWHDPLYFFAFGLGSGAMPFAPGTFGTLMAIPFYLALATLPLSFYIIFTLLFIIFSSIVSDRVSKELHVHDHPGMCIDEFAGFFVTMINAPLGWPWVILGFLLFRIFDIWKPWPIRYLDQKVHGGFGMILDDIVAGLFGCAIIQLLAWLILNLTR